MPSFTLTNRAKADLQEIGRYTQEPWGREQRILYLGLLHASFHQVAENPRIGTDCGEIRNGYRTLSVGNHIIFYRIKASDAFEIVRILHFRIDIEMQLSI